jgi:hypothetical protein
MCRIALLVALIIGLLALPASAQKLEKGAPASDAIPAPLKAAVQADGVRIFNESGAAYEEIWLRKSIDATAKAASGDIAYPGLPEGSFLGVWRYVANGSDFRGQPVKPGYYSMRHALMPSDGNHMGAWPYRDFILLVPAEADKDPSANLKFDDVVKLSRKAAGTNHPAIYPMQAPENTAEPTLGKSEEGYSVLKVKLGTPSGSFPIAFIVIGKGEQ